MNRSPSGDRRRVEAVFGLSFLEDIEAFLQPLQQCVRIGHWKIMGNTFLEAQSFQEGISPYSLLSF